MAAKELTAQLAAFSHGRVPRDLRRKQVLAEAFDLFIERGFPGASMDELARRVGVTKPVIYDLVGSKEQLFREVMAVVQEELTASIATAVAVEADLPSRLRAGILAFLRFTHQRRRGWSALLSMESGAGSAEVNAIRRQQAALVAALIAEGAGGSPDPRTLEALAQAVNGAVEFVALWWQAHPELTAEALADLLSELLAPGLVAIAKASTAKRTKPSARRRAT
ncbi:MAG: TetR/AcrR family transcriptional regulator [Myxococcaceae bacterium]|nr:MAG: TetR/AcrR family transcriptional regulator [Myxococcaceae bacterium]